MRFVYLSEKFYDKYGGYSEIMQKKSRPYACLAVEIDGITFAIPFRHHINHRYSFITKNSQGLDYSKAVVIEDIEYISAVPAWVESDDFKSIKKREKAVEKGMERYYRLYLKSLKYADNPKYSSIINYSSLKYFIKLQSS